MKESGSGVHCMGAVQMYLSFLEVTSDKTKERMNPQCYQNIFLPITSIKINPRISCLFEFCVKES